ncbi:MATE family efflux transporter [Vermiculatibacterium agrestimuris]|uniref:MATE family efflux transporter n=1 Tax=Vermiculatibacterium agrestimuris TaxID=2941519 RepID=UPI00203B1CB4|nr:MATE family efflux transporter [Vermiculatibacterium agrestimuris]
MKIQLSDHFTYPRLFRFTLPSIIMMIVTSIYSTVDGLFVSNVVGQNALAAVNIVYPLTMIVGAFGFMLGTGGSAEVARAMGMGEGEKARQYFTTLILTIIALGAALSILCVIFMEPLALLFGADEALLDDCVVYGVIMIAGAPAFMLQTSFHSFLVCAERPKMGLWLSVGSGVTNMALDYLFIAVLGWGVAGAAAATVAGYLVGGIIPLIYFLLPNKSPLRLVKTRLWPRMLVKSCANGSSELMSNVSGSLVTALYNRILMATAGAAGVAAYTVMMYLQFVFAAVFIGFSMGTASIFSYHYGAGNTRELKSLFRKCMTVIALCSLSMVAMAQLLARPLSAIFVGYDPQLLEITVAGMRIFCLSFLTGGISVFCSGFFTSLGDGLASAAISFSRTLLFQVGSILLLPRLLGVEGIWWATPTAEALALVVAAGFLWSRRRKYQYM